MSDRITANLPGIDFGATAAFYEKLGFKVDFKDAGWMILSRGALEIEFFPYPDLNPWESSFSACVRVSDANALHKEWSKLGLPGEGIPRLTAPWDDPSGHRMFALLDPNGSLLRCMSPLEGKPG